MKFIMAIQKVLKIENEKEQNIRNYMFLSFFQKDWRNVNPRSLFIKCKIIKKTSVFFWIS
jgi:hypothetical protein